MEKPIRRITMRVNILTVFLALNLISYTAILFFMGSKDREDVAELSREVMQHVQEDTNRMLSDLFESSEHVVTTISNLYRSMDEINAENEQMRSVMLSIVRAYPNVAFLYIGTEEGDIYTAEDLSFSDQKSLISKPDTPLPKNAAYCWQAIILSKGEPTETNYYLDKNFNLLVSESFPQPQFDARTRPWYVGAKKVKGLFWTPVYRFFELNTLGITGSMPLFDAAGKMFGVVGVDLSFDLLSEFFAKQTIGKSGKAFVLNSNGDLVLPEMTPEYFSTISPDVVSEAVQTYRKQKVGEFEFEWKDQTYFCNIEQFSQEDWIIAIIVPRDDFFAEFEETQKSAILIVLAILGISSLLVIYFATRLSRPIVRLATEVDTVRHLDFSKEERVSSRVKEIYLMDFAIAQMRSAMQSFTRYVPKEIVQAFFSQNKEIKLGGEKKEMTVFFSDIEDFTSITEKQPTESLMALLAEYFDEMSKLILKAGGTIDKYIGDSIMVFWGAPNPCDAQEAISAETALRCRAFVNEFNKRCAAKNLPIFKTRFGINSGVAIVGNVGTPERMNYTLISDMVNAASRIQIQNKIYGTSILIGEATQKRLDERFVTRPIDLVEVKGKKERLALYELMAMKGAAPEIAPGKEMLDLAERFKKAYETLQEGRREEAKGLFEEILRDFPNDLPTQIHLKRFQ